MSCEDMTLAEIMETVDREKKIVLWALMVPCIKNNTAAIRDTARFRDKFTNGEKKRAIRLCRMAQSYWRRECDNDAVLAFERAIGFIRREFMHR